MSEILKYNDKKDNQEIKQSSSDEDILKVSKNSKKIKEIRQEWEAHKKKDEKEADILLENKLWEYSGYISSKKEIYNGDIDNDTKLIEINQKISLIQNQIDEAKKILIH